MFKKISFILCFICMGEGIISAQSKTFTQDTFSNLDFLYRIAGVSNDEKSFSIIVNISCKPDRESTKLSSLYQEKMFDTKAIQIELSDSTLYYSDDVIAENYIDFIRFIYQFTDKSHKNLKKIILYNHELKILL